MSNAYLFLTDKSTPDQTEAFASIRKSVTGGDKAFVLFHQKVPGNTIGVDRESLYIFTNESLLALNYTPITMAVVPGSNHFPVLQFYRDFPGYSHYWVIEDDVRFSGPWEYLFDHFKRYDHDLISCHFRRFWEEPEWHWWQSLSHHTKTIGINDRIRSFNPIYRISGKALAYVHEALSDNWIGHHEVLLPTLLYHRGLKLLDFGGEGEFVADGGQNLFYTSDRSNASGVLQTGTMRFRPVWEAVGRKINKLYHPVKTPKTMQLEEQLSQMIRQQSIWASDMYALATLQPLLKDSYLPFTRFSLRPSSLSMIINDILVNQRRTIIEFGSGVSTIVMGRLMRQHAMDAKIISVEHTGHWSGIMNEAIKKEGLDHIVTIVHAPLRPCSLASNLNDWYDTDRIDESIRGWVFDMVIVDGPPAYEKDKEKARYPALPFLFNKLTGNAAVYLDDVNREGEKEVLECWAEEYSLSFSIISGTLGYCHRGQNFDPTTYQSY